MFSLFGIFTYDGQSVLIISLHILVQNSTNQAFLIRNLTNGGLFAGILLQKMQRNAKNALVFLLLGGPLFMGHPVDNSY